MSGGRRRRFDKGFKLEAVKLVVEVYTLKSFMIRTMRTKSL